MDMQASRANPNHSMARFNAQITVALSIVVSQRATKRLQNIFDSQALMFPLIHRGILEIEHHAGGAGIEHFYDEFGVIGRPGHLIALIGAPRGHFDTPVFARGRRRRKMIWLVAPQRLVESGTPS